MKKIFILFQIVSLNAFANQDGFCVASEAERLRELKKLVAPINRILETKKDKYIFLSQLDRNLLVNAGNAINEDSVIFTNNNKNAAVKNAIMHSCITSYDECGLKGSSCYVSLKEPMAKCFPSGVFCE